MQHGLFSAMVNLFPCRLSFLVYSAMQQSQMGSKRIQNQCGITLHDLIRDRCLDKSPLIFLSCERPPTQMECVTRITRK